MPPSLIACLHEYYLKEKFTDKNFQNITAPISIDTVHASALLKRNMFTICCRTAASTGMTEGAAVCHPKVLHYFNYTHSKCITFMQI